MLKSVQSGRGLAALAVAAFHLSIAFGDPRYGGQEIFGAWTFRGNLGVDFFFVLSGFIILFAHAGDIGRRDRIGPYVRKRFVRIYPIYWVYIVVFAGLLAAGLGQSATLPRGVTEWFQTVTLVRLTPVPPLIGPAWTLMHEVFFYLMFAALLFHRRYGLAVFLIWMAVCTISLPVVEDPHTGWLTYFGGLNLDFGVGMGAYLLSVDPSARRALLLAVPAALCLPAGYAAEQAGFAGTSLLYGLGFGGILVLLVRAERAGRTLALPFGVLLGNASYTIYLTHEAFEGLFLKLTRRIGFLAAHPQFNYFCVLLLTVAAGAVLYLTLEKPLLRLLRRRANRPAPAFA